MPPRDLGDATRRHVRGLIQRGAALVIRETTGVPRMSLAGTAVRVDWDLVVSANGANAQRLSRTSPGFTVSVQFLQQPGAMLTQKAQPRLRVQLHLFGHCHCLTRFRVQDDFGPVDLRIPASGIWSEFAPQELC